MPPSTGPEALGAGARDAAICIEARVVALCDVYDAVREERGYKRGHSHAEAIAVPRCGDGRTRASMFDPGLLALVVRDGGDFLDRARRHAEQGATGGEPRRTPTPLFASTIIDPTGPPLWT